SAIPLAGEGYEDWISELNKVDSLTGIIIVKGFFFLDEKESITFDEVLAHQRVNNVLKLLKIPADIIMVQVLPQEINADVRSNPFESISFERLALKNILHSAGDTIELCFPLKDSLTLPPALFHALGSWLDKRAERKDSQTYVVGIADGSGIAESADMALDRAILIQRVMIENGWPGERIHLSTGQRSSPHPIRNRCVIVYFK
ncbi:MAG: hypothetical protein ABIQ02_13760, partial [Saprospiraceae bacterium]